ncbi:hypothetical protein [Cryobacterium sp. PAMC25264]|uniref:hypothetical protein n=1 Tax=Cryobacterium sp. PAMC25264 TaxID=2861288 RepID=UPI001C62E1E0|nr:hypothetical protein [Cryobacterium sp. PAMC25264]QYF72977.1 hypothetical protein KY500_14565 [Cryobacterium sp. PAMC25264]
MTPRRVAAIILIVLGLLAAVTGAGFSYATAVAQGADHGCLVDGPFSPLADVSERSDIVTGSFSIWPLGRACAWERADGTGTDVARPGWGTTVFVVGALGLSTVGGGLLAPRRGRVPGAA